MRQERKLAQQMREAPRLRLALAIVEEPCGLSISISISSRAGALRPPSATMRNGHGRRRYRSFAPTADSLGTELTCGSKRPRGATTCLK